MGQWEDKALHVTSLANNHECDVIITTKRISVIELGQPINQSHQPLFFGFHPIHKLFYICRMGSVYVFFQAGFKKWSRLDRKSSSPTFLEQSSIFLRQKSFTSSSKRCSLNVCTKKLLKNVGEICSYCFNTFTFANHRNYNINKLLSPNLIKKRILKRTPCRTFS